MSSFDDHVVAQVLRGSRLVAAIDGVMRWMQTIVATSKTAKSWRAAEAEWQRRPVGDQRRAMATLLIVAVAVYVASVTVGGEIRGWLWTIIPGTAAAAAGLLWIFSTASIRRD